MKKRPFVSTIFLTFLGRSTGFLIPFFIAHIFGADSRTDAFFFAYTMIFFLINVSSHIFESSLVPYLTEKTEKREARVLGWKVLKGSLPVLILFSLALGIGVPAYLYYFSGWTIASTRLVVQFYFEMFPFMILSILISYHNGFFYASKSFWFPAVSPVIRSVVAIVFLLLVHPFLGIHAVTYGFVLGEMVRWISSEALVRRAGFFAESSPSLKLSAEIKNFFSEAGYQVFYVFLMNMIYLMDQTFISRLESGTISLFSYTDRLMLIPHTLFLNAVIQIFLSYWSDVYFRQSRVAFRQRIKKDSVGVAFIAVVLSLGMFFFRVPFIHLLYRFSSLSMQQLDMFAVLFGWLALAFPGAVMRLVYGRVIFVMKRSRILVGLTAVEFLTKLMLNVYFLRKFGAVGIPMSSAVIFTASAIFLYFYVRRTETDKVTFPEKTVLFQTLTEEQG